MSLTPPFGVTQLEHGVILTLLIDSLNAHNGHTVKEAILDWIKREQPEGLVLDLHHVLHMGHLGLGALIALHSALRGRLPLALIGLQPEVLARVRQSQLEQILQIWQPGQDCPLCGQSDCRHLGALSEWAQGQGRPSLPERPLPPADHTLERLPRSRAVQIALGGLLVAGVVALTWLAAQQYLRQTPPAPMTEDQLISRFDKDGNGNVDRADLLLMDPVERLTLSFSPYCERLQLDCGPGYGRR